MSREVSYDLIVEKVKHLCIETNCIMPDEIKSAMKKSEEIESSIVGKSVLNKLIENARIAENENIPICQDTGLSVFLVELGVDVVISGKSRLITDAINEGVAAGYSEGYLRYSVVSDPVFDRKNTGNNTPAFISIDLVNGSDIRISFMPKGAGSENVSTLKMFNPSDTTDDIIDFVVNTVVQANGNPCPPVIIGIGIGGTFDKAAHLAKRALFRDINQRNSDGNYSNLEKTILEKINQVGIDNLTQDECDFLNNQK